MLQLICVIFYIERFDEEIEQNCILFNYLLIINLYFQLTIENADNCTYEYQI